MSDRRKREIRKLMAETGMNYTRAAREMELRRTVDAPSAADSIEAGSAFAEIQRGIQEHARQAARVGDLGVAGRQIAEIQRGIQEHARQAARVGDLGVAGRQIAEIQRGIQEHVKHIAEIRRQAERANVLRVRFTPPV